ncbi:hypothetical protein COV53_04410 [Candidatus Gottesmanbacteria bacterium CG11_big_fil_rev_8_21_14_0_20_37_11]|uniref:Uncharacterized protein n=3 Tax=Candidatus Gottesmaniibacteriota TaxID=1752720 RepID=A0A2M7RSC3_9BACT|nr:MAG: hypothetical protein AUJ73_04450 [Candidatus Gottesmanbacteria bacterium CG1_02_37_22]PIP32701.1 MAG: hypothetical protein COX23_03435 [Candidatus Gottesmanbacteria bacterium CG23_combo_of_CG06-09_8_20_14_all_37_19]PIR08180.1 MAG: hypothetical protein COV53_04410 [Candidatus Gottesmanbacteria bacterium CG11_big_fil_rev_8_21_14_0_20_37_11]PIZ03110.1 MAG: hypothetical protein COY59_01220 [Candidatus Gottesmanbacteria bacterium CG_4_10_14_0_8_um_filter_37_24]
MIKIFLYCVLLFLLFPKPAQAYLDPGTGSYVFQLLVAGLLGSLFFLKSAVKKIKKLISEKFTQKISENPDENK